MEHIMKMERRNGVGIGFYQHDIHPANGEGRVGKSGIDKSFTLEKIIELAYKMDEKPNIIIRATPKSKWYLKRFPRNSIETEIQKSQWRNKPENIMYIIEWD